jgi:hypothetical protein
MARNLLEQSTKRELLNQSGYNQIKGCCLVENMIMRLSLDPKSGPIGVALGWVWVSE